MSKKKRAEDDGAEQLNLVPIMNLVVCLIPIILFGTVMVKVGVINVNAPKFGPHFGKKVEGPPLNLALGIGDDGFRLKATGVDVPRLLAEEGLPFTDGFIPRTQGKYDFANLYTALMAIKVAYPGESVMNLSADPGTHFEVIVKTIDSVRYQLADEVYEDGELYAQAPIRREDGKRALLWPDVVFTTVH